MRWFGRLIALIIAAAGAALFAVALGQIGIAFVALINDPKASRSTCAAMQFFGAQDPFCGASTPFQPLSDLLTSMMTKMNPFYVWGVAAFCAAVAIGLALQTFTPRRGRTVAAQRWPDDDA